MKVDALFWNGTEILFTTRYSALCRKDICLRLKILVDPMCSKRFMLAPCSHRFLQITDGSIGKVEGRNCFSLRGCQVCLNPLLLFVHDKDTASHKGNTKRRQ